MTPDQNAELLDLYLDDELALALRAHVEAHLASDPGAARDAHSLHETVARLKAAPAPRPDDWYVERLLDGLLREDAAARPHTHTNAR